MTEPTTRAKQDETKETGVTPKVGDWGFYEFRVATVKEMGKYGPTISNGVIQIGTRDFDGWRPLTLRNAAVSRYFADMSDKLHREGSNGLNYPDFARHLVNLWSKACDGDDNATERAAKFIDDVLRADRDREVDGIALTRPR